MMPPLFASACYPLSRRRRLSLALSLLLSAACSIGETQAETAGKNLRPPPTGLAQLEQKMEALAKNYAMLACGIDFEQVLTEIRKDCAKSLPRSPRPSPGGLAAPELQACPAKVVQQVLDTQEARLKINFAQALQEKRHAVVPFGRGKLPAEDLGDLDEGRKERLAQLLQVPFIDSTKLLLVTADSEDPPRSDQRLDLVRRFLQNHVNLPNAARHIDTPLLLHIASKKEPPRYSFDYARDGEPKDLSLWVWIFRIDC